MGVTKLRSSVGRAASFLGVLGKTASLCFPASSGCLHPLARGSFLHLHGQEERGALWPSGPSVVAGSLSLKLLFCFPFPL